MTFADGQRATYSQSRARVRASVMDNLAARDAIGILSIGVKSSLINA
jgi:hypothetical protein